MSNVIHASVDYSGPDKQAVVGKIYEDLYQDSEGNVSVRYIRLIKATAAIASGDICAVAATDADDLFNLGEAAPLGTVDVPAYRVAGVAVADIASGEFGFVICRGKVELLKVAAAYAGGVGAIIGTSATAGEVAVTTTANAVVGQALSAKAAAPADPTISAYINVL